VIQLPVIQQGITDFKLAGSPGKQHYDHHRNSHGRLPPAHSILSNFFDLSRSSHTSAPFGIFTLPRSLHTVATVPGLVSKHWLADDESNTYGDVYIWEDRDAYEGFVNSELFSMVGSNPALANIVSKDFDVIEGSTWVTRGF
jgi:heme-degrading monooxygenase HmoA